MGLVKKGIDVMFPGLDFTRKEVNILGSRNSVNCFPEAITFRKRSSEVSAVPQIPMWDIVPVLRSSGESGCYAQRV